jgi:hypothetical protein
MGVEDCIKVFFHMQQSIRLYHWQTKIYSRHIASATLLDGLDTLIDKFVEVYIGQSERPRFPSGIKIIVDEVSDETVIELLKYFVNFLKTIDVKHTDLLNIRDEMLALVNQTLYLMTFS